MNFKRRKTLKALDSGSCYAKEKGLYLFHFKKHYCAVQFLVSKNVAKPTLNQIKFAKNQKSRLTWNISSVLGNHSVSKVQTTG